MTGGRQKVMRGFACVDPNKRREIAAAGGRSHKPEQRPYARDRALAVEAGRRGGLARGAKVRADIEAGFEGQEQADYLNARSLGFSAAEARGIVRRSRRP